MWIDPLGLRHRPLQHDRLVCVKLRGERVVSEDRRPCQSPDSQCGDDARNSAHAASLIQILLLYVDTCLELDIPTIPFMTRVLEELVIRLAPLERVEGQLPGP